MGWINYYNFVVVVVFIHTVWRMDSKKNEKEFELGFTM